MTRSDNAHFYVVEASIGDLGRALTAGVVTSVELVAAYLNRIGFYDRQGIRLNSVPVLNPDLFIDAQASDERREQGASLGPLDGIPYTAKASYQAQGLPVSSGSPAFENLIASQDAFTIERLRGAGAILVGLTNMPPMADGGMHRGLYGRAESPYNEAYLTSAFVSGSSNGSGTSTAASFAAFGLGEETWSSGRAPASHNGLVAYTPSRGVISMRGNWPLFPTMDVVVPHTRSVSDMLDVLNVIVGDDVETRGDFWRVQPYIEIPAASAIRPLDYRALADSTALAGVRLGVPRMYINRDAALTEPISTRDSVIRLWEQARESLEALGATVVDVDLPIVSNDEGDRAGAHTMVTRGLIPPRFADDEMSSLAAYAWDDYLRRNADPRINRLMDVDGQKIFPFPPGSLPDRFEYDSSLDGLVERASAVPLALEDVPSLAESLRGLDETRRVDLSEWMDALNLDAIVFPSNADVAPHDADVNPVSNEIAWRNGVGCSNGNAAIRRYGIPTVTVAMGCMDDTRMPVGMTFAGRAYSDNTLLSFGFAFEASGERRVSPPRTPALPTERLRPAGDVVGACVVGSPPRGRIRLAAQVSEQDVNGLVQVTLTGTMSEDCGGQVSAYVNGQPIDVTQTDHFFSGGLSINSREHSTLHSHWRGPYGSLVVVIVRDAAGRAVSGSFVTVGGQG